MPVSQKVVSNTQEFEEWKKKYLLGLAFEVFNREDFLNFLVVNLDFKEKLLKEIEKKYRLNEHCLLQSYNSIVPCEKFMNELRKNDFRELT